MNRPVVGEAMMEAVPARGSAALMDTALKDAGPFAGHAPDQERPLGGYALLTGTYLTLTGSFAAWVHHARKPVADRVEGKDIVLTAIATHKLARLIAKDRVT